MDSISPVQSSMEATCSDLCALVYVCVGPFLPYCNMLHMLYLLSVPPLLTQSESVKGTGWTIVKFPSTKDNYSRRKSIKPIGFHWYGANNIHNRLKLSSYNIIQMRNDTKPLMTAGRKNLWVGWVEGVERKEIRQRTDSGQDGGQNHTSGKFSSRAGDTCRKDRKRKKK